MIEFLCNSLSIILVFRHVFLSLDYYHLSLSLFILSINFMEPFKYFSFRVMTNTIYLLVVFAELRIVLLSLANKLLLRNIIVLRHWYNIHECYIYLHASWYIYFIFHRHPVNMYSRSLCFLSCFKWNSYPMRLGSQFIILKQ